MDNSECLERGVHDPGIAQQEHPGVGANQKAGPEGQHDEVEEQGFVACGTSDVKREGKAQKQAEQCGNRREPNGTPQDGEIERIERPLVIFNSFN